MTRPVALGPGAKVSFDGRAWDVTVMSGGRVTLQTGDETVTAALSTVVADPGFRVLVDQTGRLGDEMSPAVTAASIALDGLTKAQRQRVQERIDAVLLRRNGSIPGAPPDPALVGLSLRERTEVLAARMDVSARTIEEWDRALQREGVAGVIDKRLLPSARPVGGIDVRYRSAIADVLDHETDRSTKTDGYLVERIRERAQAVPAEPDNPLPEVSDRTLRRYLDRMGRGRGRRGSTRARRSIANRPPGAWSRLQATRLGEVVAIDATPLDAFAMDPLSGDWRHVHLLLALDLCTRSIVGWRFTGGEPNKLDACLLLHDIITARPWPEHWPLHMAWRYSGIPSTLVAGLLETAPVLPDDLLSSLGDGEPSLFSVVPAVVPEAVVVDHGKVFMSDAFRRACATLGINLELARPYTPTDKAHVERVFDTIRTGFVQGLPGYKGSDVYSRGTRATVEEEAFYFIDEIEDRFAAWVAMEYQLAPHDGLRLHSAPGVSLSPNDAVDIAVATTGYVPVPASPDLAINLLPAEFREVRGHGIECNLLYYDQPTGSILDDYRHRPSPFTVHGNKWPVKVDRRDLSRIWFFHFDDPTDPQPGHGHWEAIPARGLPEGVPFSQKTLEYAKRLVRRRGAARLDRDEVVRELRPLLARIEHASAGSTAEEKKLAYQEYRAQVESGKRTVPATPRKRRAPAGLPIPFTEESTEDFWGPTESSTPVAAAQPAEPPRSRARTRDQAQRGGSDDAAIVDITPMEIEEAELVDPFEEPDWS